MSEVTREWTTTGFFLVMIVVTIIVEVLWLVRKRWTTSGRAVGFVMISDILSMSIGTFVSFAIVGVILMAAFSGGLSDVPGGDATIWAALITAFVFPYVLLFLTKRLLLLAFKIRSGGSAWVYSLVASVFVILFPLVPSAAFYYLLGKLF